jgi:hypothetical protein
VIEHNENHAKVVRVAPVLTGGLVIAKPLVSDAA